MTEAAVEQQHHEIVSIEKYTNNELYFLLKQMKETLGKIEVQTTKTNGRVTELEKSTDVIPDRYITVKEFQIFRDLQNKWLGALTFVSVVVLPVALVLLKVLWK